MLLILGQRLNEVTAVGNQFKIVMVSISESIFKTVVPS